MNTRQQDILNFTEKHGEISIKALVDRLDQSGWVFTYQGVSGGFKGF